MASLIGASLARSGQASVRIAGGWAEALERIACQGIIVEEGAQSWQVRVPTAHVSQSAGLADHVLVLVKSYQTPSVAHFAARALAQTGFVTTLQNGLGNRETLERAADRGRVGIGVATLGATLLGPAHIRAFPGSITLGLDTEHHGPIRQLTDLFNAAGLPTEITPQIDRMIWRKLAVNCSINPLSAVLGIPNGALIATPHGRATLCAAAQEVASVAVAKGIELGADAGDLAVQVAQATAENRSSMLQDLERGAPTEIDALSGEVVREGRALGVPTPIQHHLWREVRMRETGRHAVVSIDH